jgi:hypothetical protein
MMFIRDHSPGAYAVRVCCLICHKMFSLADMVIDRDGPAFLAYYCPACVPEEIESLVVRCGRWDCPRPECSR